MINNWISYLREEILNDYDVVLKLLDIDNEVQGYSLNLKELLFYLEKNLYTNKFFSISFGNDDCFLVEGEPYEVIELFNDLMGFRNNVNICKNNLALNKWLFKKYENFSIKFGITSKINAVFSDYYSFNRGDLFVLGSDSFYFENRDCVSNNINVIRIVE